jgi:hypothetical protein
MRFDVSALDRASATFLKIGDAVDRLEKKLKDLDRVKVEIKPRLDSAPMNADIVAMRKRLREATKNPPKFKIEVDLDGISAAEAKVEQLRAKLTSLTGASAQVDVDTGAAQTNIDALHAKMTALRGLSPLQLRIEVDDQATAQLSAIEAAASALAGMNPTVHVDVDAIAALAQIAALATSLGALGANSPTVNINLNELSFLGQLARIRQEINTLSGGRVEIDADTQRAMEELARLRVRLSELSRMEQTVVVQADTALARHQIDQIEQQLAQLNGQTATAHAHVELDRSWADAVVRVAALGRALATLAIPVALASAVPVVAALGGAAVSAAGSVAILPGALLAAGAAAAGLKVGLAGVGDALKDVGDAEKFAEALEKLSPAARAFAIAVRDIGPAWKSVQLDTQERLFAGLGDEMRRLSGTYLPSMRAGLTGVAGEFNGMAKDLVGFATSAETVRDVDGIFRNTTSALQAARPAASNLAAAFMDIGAVGATMLPQMANGLTNATENFRRFIAQARESGQIQQWIQGGVDTLRTLGSIAGNVGSTLGAVFAAQRAAGADLLSTLDSLTEGMSRYVRSAEGQSNLVAFFAEIRRTIDAIRPGLEALGRAAMSAISAFANTGGLQAAGQAFSQMSVAIAPLVPALGALAGGVVNNLANALSGVAAVIGPIASGLSDLLGALGPIPAAVIAMAVAFRMLGPVNALITGLGASLAGLATRMGASQAAAGAIASSFSRIGSAVPYVGVAVVALAAAWDALTVSTSEAQRAMEAGGTAAQEAASGLAAQSVAVDFMSQKYGVLGGILDIFTTSTEEARASMSPLQQAQLDAATAANLHGAAVEKFGASSPQAIAAMDGLRSANERVAAEQERAADAGRSHADVVRDLGQAMQSQIGSALAYEQAVARTAEAHKRAGEAFSESGAKSQEYQSAVLSLAQAQESQAQAARRQAEATGTAQQGLDAYNTELLRLNDGSAQGRDAFLKLASNLDNAGLSALSATAQMTGLRTEIITLPDGRTVRVITEADTGKLQQVKADLDALAGQEYVGTVTIDGNPIPFRDGVMQSVTFANGQTGMVRIDGDGAPIRALIGQTKYTIDATTGVMTIDGNPAPGEANLTGFKMVVDATTGAMQIVANTAPAAGQLAGIVGQVNSSAGTITIDGNASLANGKVTAAVTLADGSKGTITIDGNQQPANGKITATITYANGSTGTIKVNANDAAARAAIAALQRPTSSTHTIRVTTTGEVLGKGNTGRAAGAYTTPRAAGAYTVTGYAEGGMRSMSAGRAEVVPARSLRVIGDRQTNDEAFIPVVPTSPRSQAILNTTANRMGYNLVPKAAAPPDDDSFESNSYYSPNRGKPGAVQAEDGSWVLPGFYGQSASPGAPTLAGSAPGPFTMGTLQARWSMRRMAAGGLLTRGGTTGAALSSIRSAASQRSGSGSGMGGVLKVLNAALREIGRSRSGGGTQIVNNWNVAMNRAADEVARVQRRHSSMGLIDG